MVEEGTDIGPFETFTLEDAGSKGPAAQKVTVESADLSEGGEEEAKSPTHVAEAESTTTAQEPDTSEEKLETSLDREPLVSPAIKALALNLGVPIKNVKGSGPDGRVTKQDVEEYKTTTFAAVIIPPT